MRLDQKSPSVVTIVVLSSSLLTAQIPMQVAFSLLVFEYVLVGPVMADVNTFLLAQPQADQL